MVKNTQRLPAYYNVCTLQVCLQEDEVIPRFCLNTCQIRSARGVQLRHLSFYSKYFSYYYFGRTNMREIVNHYFHVTLGNFMVRD